MGRATDILTGHLDFDALLPLPVAGVEPAAREASAAGASIAERHYGRKVLAYLALLASSDEAGINDFAAVEALQPTATPVAGVQSINSIRAKLGDLVEHTQTHDTSAFGSRRGRYRLSAAGRLWWTNYRARVAGSEAA